MNPTPTRILLVDDDPEFVRVNCHGLSYAFPDTPVDSAASIDAGMALLKGSGGSKRQPPMYDVVILDFKLPSTGEPAHIDVTLCDEARRLNPDSLVIHVTGNPTDDVMLTHLAAAHGIQEISQEFVSGRQRLHQGICLRKDEKILPRMVEAIKNHQRLRNVVARLERLVGGASAFGHQRFVGRSSGISMTGELASLTRELGAVWPLLPEKHRQQVRQHLTVREEGETVRVSVL